MSIVQDIWFVYFEFPNETFKFLPSLIQSMAVKKFLYCND